MTWAIFSDEHIRAIGEIIHGASSGRVAAIVGGAILDDTLRRTLSERLRNDEDTANKLLRVGRALGNTGPKIDMLYMIGAFEKPVRNSLHGLIEIRNYFAHALNPSFNSQSREMVRAAKKLTLHKGRTHYPHAIYDEDTDEEIEDIANNRDLFLVNLKLCLIALMRDRVTHDTWSNKPITKTAMHKIKRERKLWERKQRALPKP